MRRLDLQVGGHDGVASFLRLRREARGLALLRAHLASGTTEEALKQRFRQLRGIGRRRSTANGETDPP